VIHPILAARDRRAALAHRSPIDARGHIPPGAAARLLVRARELTEPAHRAAVEELPSELRHVAGYHAGWWDADGRSCLSTGKAIRPALTLACAHGAGAVDVAVNDAVVAAAVAVELVHDFSLLHDDVMDGDLTRRHRPAAWTVFRVSPAILVGDALLALAMRQLAADESLQVLTVALLELCRGQSADLAFQARTDVGLAECLTMAELKTGALLGAACQLGALAAGADQAATDCFRRFGRHLGVAFQLIDDLLGIWGDPQVTGKPAGSDLISRKRSLPVVAALTSGRPAAEQLAWLYEGREDLDEAAISQMTRLIEAAGGRAWVSTEADHQMRCARTALEQAQPEPEARSDLQLLADLITCRDR
jgi:geranylgeranyl diphosphate synthase type I